MGLSEAAGEYSAYFLDHWHRLGLNALIPPYGKVLWHYTTGEALLGIIESGSIYATQISCLNDSTELRYFFELFRNALFAIQERDRLASEEGEFLSTFLRQLDGSDRVNSDSSWFVTCFSTARDDLSQWRAYCGGENGYAIGFDVSGLLNKKIVTPVSYDVDEHRNTASQLAVATMQFFREGLDKTTQPLQNSGPSGSQRRGINFLSLSHPHSKIPRSLAKKNAACCINYRTVTMAGCDFGRNPRSCRVICP
ncbi:MAG: DUF2971 domain-containing protein [Acidobacteriota bacterium]|nr:DUF2971 domain-containing protein [Acidobacteriota bacterium]